MTKTKACTKCGETKPLSEFYQDNKMRDGRCSHCKECRSAYARARYAAHPREDRYDQADYHLQCRFGITLDDYGEMLEAQDGGCAICGRTEEEEGRRLCVDHNHETGKVRGLLCNACNAGLGRFDENPDLLHRAVDYIKHYQGR